MFKHGIEYIPPTVSLLNASPMWVAEVAGRTAYDSFANSEHVGVKLFPTDKGQYFKHNPDIESSEILTSLAWVYHHHSVIELIDISFSINGTSRGVLQEHARHRIQSLTVQSTRYTMSGVLNAYIASSHRYAEISVPSAKGMFYDLLVGLETFVIAPGKYLRVETDAIYDKLASQLETGEIGIEDMVSKEGLDVALTGLPGENMFPLLQRCKKKRNVGDAFKHIVTDNWKVDMIVKFNLRSLKNYLDLRASSAAYWQIGILAAEMIKATPLKYLNLVVKEDKLKKYISN